MNRTHTRAFVGAGSFIVAALFVAGIAGASTSQQQTAEPSCRPGVVAELTNAGKYRVCPGYTLAPDRPAGPTTSPKPTPSASGSAPIPTTAAPTTPAPATSAPKPSPSSPQPTTTTPSALTYVTVQRTLYDWWDNDCGGPGDCLAYPPYHAGGDGTYGKPISVAARKGAYPIGTLIYDPAIGYGQIVDTCASCAGGQVDWWADGRDLSADESRRCMESLTGRFPIVVNPPAGLPLPGTGPIASKDGCGR